MATHSVFLSRPSRTSYPAPARGVDGYFTAARGKPPTGSAILSGKLSGPIPLNATVRILYRPDADALGDGVLVAMAPVDATGSWQVSGLKADLKYDVVARREGYNDVITANVSPVAI